MEVDQSQGLGQVAAVDGSAGPSNQESLSPPLLPVSDNNEVPVSTAEENMSMNNVIQENTVTSSFNQGANCSNSLDPQNSEMECETPIPVHLRTGYEKMDDLFLRIPPGWGHSDLRIFVDCVHEHIEFLKAPTDAGDGGMAFIASICVKRGGNPHLFTASKCIQLSQCLRKIASDYFGKGLLKTPLPKFNGDFVEFTD